MIVTLVVNGEPRAVEVAGWESLLRVLREHLGLTGAKDACEQGECGACSVVLDRELVCSCLVMAADAEGADVVTVEGIAGPGGLEPVQQAFVDAGAVQCGFCTPGMVVAVTHVLSRRPDATPEELREQLAGNLCRCTGYGAMLRAAAAVGRPAGAGR